MAEWGMLIGVAIVGSLGLFMTYIVLQGTRTQLKWRQMAASGDVPTIRRLIEEALDAWRRMRVPKEVAPDTWHAIQTAELVDVGPDFVSINCTAEGQYATVEGQRRQVKTALEQGMEVTAKLMDMVFYDIPNLKLPSVRVDIYSTFLSADGTAQQRCILSTTAQRSAAIDLDWDGLTAKQIVDHFGGKYRLAAQGTALPIDNTSMVPEWLRREG